MVCRFEKVDSFVSGNNIGKVDFIKIDAEGHELFVLKGALETLRKLRPVVQIEINAFALSMSNTSVTDIMRFFEECSYELYYFENNALTKLDLSLIEQGKFHIAFADIAYLFDMICLPKK